MRGFVALVAGDEGDEVCCFFGGTDESMLKKLLCGCSISRIFLETFFDKVLEFFTPPFFGI